MARTPGMKPVLTTLWAAGLSFHRCHAEKNVPIDPHLEFIFTGEEIDRAIRLWTHGYDLYLPTRSVISHNYTAASQTFWRYDDSEKQGRSKSNMSHKKLLKLLQMQQPEEQQEHAGEFFQLGKQRTLAEWHKWGRPFDSEKCYKRLVKWPGVADRKALIASARHPSSKAKEEALADEVALAEEHPVATWTHDTL